MTTYYLLYSGRNSKIVTTSFSTDTDIINLAKHHNADVNSVCDAVTVLQSTGINIHAYGLDEAEAYIAKAREYGEEYQARCTVDYLKRRKR